jgi:hypothetical protein
MTEEPDQCIDSKRPGSHYFRRTYSMQDLLEAIRAATAEGATADQKTAGAQACRTILTALEAEVGKPISLPGTPVPNPVAGIDPSQALDLLIARIRAALPVEEQKTATPRRPEPSGLRIALVRPPPGVPRRKR